MKIEHYKCVFWKHGIEIKFTIEGEIFESDLYVDRFSSAGLLGAWVKVASADRNGFLFLSKALSVKFFASN